METGEEGVANPSRRIKFHWRNLSLTGKTTWGVGKQMLENSELQIDNIN